MKKLKIVYINVGEYSTEFLDRLTERFEVVIPELDGRPDDALIKLDNLTNKDEVVVVGEGYGSFYADWIANKNNVPLCLFNPLYCSDKKIEEISGGGFLDFFTGLHNYYDMHASNPIVILLNGVESIKFIESSKDKYFDRVKLVYCDIEEGIEEIERLSNTIV